MLARSQVTFGKLDPVSDLFKAAPAPSFQKRSNPGSPATKVMFPSTPKTPPPSSQAKEVEDPINVWVPQKLQRAREASNYYPKIKVQGKRQSLMQPQPLVPGHPLFDKCF
jgi:hypothetical protein